MDPKFPVVLFLSTMAATSGHSQVKESPGVTVTLSHCDTVTMSEKQQLHCHPQNNYSRTGTPEGTGRSFSLDVVVIKVTMRSVNCNVTVTSCRAMVPNHRGVGPYWYQTTDKLNSSISDVTPTTN